MGKTSIEWCDFTHNFWVGCQKVSAACDHCYAESWAKRTGHPELWQGERRRTAPANWRQPLKWNASTRTLRYPRQRVFTNSLADFFDNQAPITWRREAWHVIDQTPNIDWLILTKRPQNIVKMLPEPDAGYSKPWDRGWPNVWLGTTVENQEEADRRIPHLLAVPAKVHFLSCEPLLGPIHLSRLRGPGAHINWTIVGGESGPHARPMHPDWARSLRDQCAAAGVPFFFKQWGESVPAADAARNCLLSKGDIEIAGKLLNGRVWCHEMPPGSHPNPTMIRVGKKHAGRLLDGIEHNGAPS